MGRVMSRRAGAVQVGYAADERGEGVAYALLGESGSPLRVTFRVRRVGGLQGREIGYAALTAVVGALRARGFRALTLEIAEPVIPLELDGLRPIPPALGMSYVTLRCALNGLTEGRIRAIAPDAVADLENRARAEVSLHVAA